MTRKMTIHSNLIRLGVQYPNRDNIITAGCSDRIGYVPMVAARLCGDRGLSIFY